MKVSVENCCFTCRADEMEIGQVGVMKYGPSITYIVLRTYSGLIALDDPHKTWENTCSAKVNVYPPGTALQLITEI